jgi:hypothetical protein
MPARAEESGVIKTLETFEGKAATPPAKARKPEAITFWRWAKEDKENAKEFSRLETGSMEGATGNAFKVAIFKSLPRGLDFYTLWLTDLDYLPPGARAIRLRARVVSGQFTLTVGSPTVYFGNSDVWARPQILTPSETWQTLAFSLVSDLERNFRRPVFSAESPTIYYTRWIQEPLRLMIGEDSQGELWVDDITLVGLEGGGEFPVYAPDKVRALGKADLGGAFTFATDDKEFDLSHTPGKGALRKPAILKLPPDKETALVASQRGLEEMSFIGVPVSCPEETNAIRLTMKMDHPTRSGELVVDLWMLVAPDGRFPWTRPATTDGGIVGFDYCLSPSRTIGTSWGFYHARRTLRNGEGSTLVVPFADFVCGYGTGDLLARHRRQQPLLPREVVAVGLVSPFQQAAGETLFTIQSIEPVRVEEASVNPESFPQRHDLSKTRLEPQAQTYGKRVREVEVKEP